MGGDLRGPATARPAETANLDFIDHHLQLQLHELLMQSDYQIARALQEAEDMGQMPRGPEVETVEQIFLPPPEVLRERQVIDLPEPAPAAMELSPNTSCCECTVLECPICMEPLEGSKE